MNTTPATIERLSDAEGIEKHFTITARDVQIVSDLRSLMVEANADDRDAFQAAGYLYGDLSDTTVNFLDRVLGNRAAAYAVYYEHLLDTYGCKAETEAAFRAGLRAYGEDHGWIPVVTWTE
jgi:hypothetical protein